MRKLGEQWVEKGQDEKMHMYKAVHLPMVCNGCVFLRYDPDGFYGCNRGRLGCPVGDDVVVKDLGILNEDGCLPSSWGEYPTISVPSYEKEPWCVYAYLRRKEVVIKQEKAWGDTEQEVKDNWNRRA